MSAKRQGYAEALRALPGVDRLAAEIDAPFPLAVQAARRAIEACRAAILAGEAPGDPLTLASAWLDALRGPSLRGVINATGVILHTGLGRAVLSTSAQQAVAVAAAGYTNLEVSLESGERSVRSTHVAALLCELTGAQAAMAVNNAAGAVLLAVAALSGPSGRAIISRGELVEIGGGFRVPEVIAQAGAALVEVGTTNRTRVADFAAALQGPGDVIVRVHPSNFRMVGFTEQTSVAELCALGAPVIEDLGSGALLRTPLLEEEEPDVRASIAAGVSLAVFSGDKLLGGPQAGLLVGRAEAIAAAAAHPLARALRIDKLSLAALEATLRLHLDPARAAAEIPALAMLVAGEAELAARAAAIAGGIGPGAEVVGTVSRVGGGALPLAELPGPAVAVSPAHAGMPAALRCGEPPVLARVQDGRVLLDPRTVIDAEVPALIAAVRTAQLTPPVRI